MMSTKFLDKKTIAELTARMYLDTGAVRFMTDKPFIFTRGWASPVYNDSRWLMSFPDVRSTLMDFAVATIERDIGRDKIDAVAGGETAGIPFAAWVADRMHLPMQYVRKKPKGFGRGAQIEGQLIPGQRVLLVEDLATDGKSKVNFVKALREAGGHLRPLLRDFLLRHLSAEQENPRRSRRHAARAHDLEGRAGRRQGERQVRAEDAGRGGEIHRRSGRLVESTWRGGRSRGVKQLALSLAQLPISSAPPPDRAPTETATCPAASAAAGRASSRRPSADRSAGRASPRAMPIESSSNGLPVGPITVAPIAHAAAGQRNVGGDDDVACAGTLGDPVVGDIGAFAAR